jgi:plastocyanin
MFAPDRLDAFRLLLVVSLLFMPACGRTPAPPETDVLEAAPATRSAGAAAAAPGNGMTLSVSGKAPAPVSGSATLVFLELHGGTPPDDAAETPPVMDQASLTFFPGLLLVRTGRPVSFQNHDSELHNINVFEDATKEQSFNIALPNGGSYVHTFAHDGFYSVRCDVHPAMSADIVATSSPYATLTGPDGRFSFEHVVPGTYTATVYAAGKKTQQELALGASRTDLVLGATP